MWVRVSIVDERVVSEKEKGERGIEDSVRLGEGGDEVGYERFWVCEDENNCEVGG
ncbi:hypothetical protein [Bacillus altitudinis]|uniref:hypothetical protein n=1 Tax=Bacillus altitudinis TaxID=293387 RepID=UPI001643BBD4|nr:hypothetical protein [Bacillus altitudinis]